MLESKPVKSVIFNLTIACFKAPFNPVYEEVDGELQFVETEIRDYWSRYAEFTRTSLKLVEAQEGQMGTWKEGIGYTDGILGLLQNKQANKPYVLVPIDIKDAPGVFTVPWSDNTFTIGSINAYPEVIPSDIFLSLFTVEPYCWIVFIAIIFIVHMLSLLVADDHRESGKGGGLPTWFSRLVDIGFQVVETAFKQGSVAKNGRPLKIMGALLVTIYLAIVGAAYSTNAILYSNTNVELVENLMDIIRLNKVPRFIESDSVQELFSLEAGSEFAAVYKHAQEMQSEKPLPKDLGTLKNLTVTEADCLNLATLTSVRLNSVIQNFIETYCATIIRQKVKHFMSNPYHRTILMDIISPPANGSLPRELIKRDQDFLYRYLESGINHKMSQKSREKLNRYADETLNLHIVADEEIEKLQNKEPEIFYIQSLNVSNFIFIFQIIVIFHFICLVIVMKNLQVDAS